MTTGGTMTTYGTTSDPKVKYAWAEFEVMTEQQQSLYTETVLCGADHEDAIEVARKLRTV